MRYDNLRQAAQACKSPIGRTQIDLIYVSQARRHSQDIEVAALPLCPSPG